MPLNKPGAEHELICTEELVRKSHDVIWRSERLKAAALASGNGFKGTVNPIGSTAGYSLDDFLHRKRYSMLNWTVVSALRITSAAKANLQLFDPTTGGLRIVAQHGFRPPFLDFFNCVHGGEAACGKALEARGRIVVEDVTESPIFQGSSALEVLLDARVRAVQSTPLIGSWGAVLGMISTHWTLPHRWSDQAWAPLDVLAQTVARWLEHTTVLSAAASFAAPIDVATLDSRA